MLFNGMGEVEVFIEVVCLFLEVEKNFVELRCLVFEEYLIEVIYFFNQVIKIYCVQGNLVLGVCLCLEIGDVLRYMNWFYEVMVYY